MKLESFTRSLESMLEVPSGSFSPETKFRATDGWDSLMAIQLVSLLDNDFGVVIDFHALEEAETVSDLFALVEAAAQVQSR